MKKSLLTIMMILGVLIITSCSKDVENKVNWDILHQSLTSEEFLALQVKANGATMPFEEALKLYRDILPLTKGEQVNDWHTHGFVLCGYKSKQIQYIDRVYRYVGGESGNPNELNSRDWELFSEDISITESNSVYINWGGYGYNDGFFLSNSYDIPDNEYNLQVLTFTNIAPLQ